MKTVVNYRACGALYNFLKSNSITGKVLIPANICETVPATYIKAGMEIAFFDISNKDFMPDDDLIYHILDVDNTVTVLHYNHTYGCLNERSDNQLFCNIKKRYPKLVIIDDRCLCKPIFNVYNTNCYADMYLYSTGHVKYADIGYGGFAHIGEQFNYIKFDLAFNKQTEDAFDRHIKQCHSENCGVSKKILLGDWLNNSNVDMDNYCMEVQNAIVKADFHKEKINKVYGVLRGKLQDKYNNWRFQILVANQDECMRAIFNSGLFASKHYKSLGNGYFSDVKTPNAEWLEAHIINLFNDFRFDITQAEQMVEVLNKVMIPIEVY